MQRRLPTQQAPGVLVATADPPGCLPMGCSLFLFWAFATFVLFNIQRWMF